LDQVYEWIVNFLAGQVLDKLLSIIGITGPIQKIALNSAVTAFIVMLCWSVIALLFSAIHRAIEPLLLATSNHLKEISGQIKSYFLRLRTNIFNPVVDFIQENRYRFYFNDYFSQFKKSWKHLQAPISQMGTPLTDQPPRSCHRRSFHGLGKGGEG
jgi:hypothetical protein